MASKKRFAIIVDCNNVTRLIDRENELISMDFGFDLEDLSDYEKSKVQEWLDLLNEKEAEIDYLKDMITAMKLDIKNAMKMVSRWNDE